MVLQRNKSIPVWGWADDASDSNLYNKEEFPASPCRTDNWEMITATEKYKFNK
jgi:sialate O-acetylesterase